MRAFLTGVTGQTGSYLAELLLDKGFEVHAMLRWTSNFGHTKRIDHIRDRMTTYYADMTDTARLKELLLEIRPDEVYNLAAQSHVGVSFLQPHHTEQVNYHAVLDLLQVCAAMKPQPKFYQASTSEMFGSSPAPQTESSAFRPQSPYAAAKLKAHHETRLARSRGMYAVSGILFNHESPRRGQMFVTRKVTSYVARVLRGDKSLTKLRLGRLTPKRDWGYAPEYADAIYRMMHMTVPADYVIATGESHSVGELVEEAFGLAGLDWRKYIVHDPEQDRPREVEELRGCADKAKKEMGWEPKVRFKELVKIMLDADMEETHAAGIAAL